MGILKRKQWNTTFLAKINSNFMNRRLAVFEIQVSTSAKNG